MNNEKSKQMILENITKIYPGFDGKAEFKAVDDISLKVESGEFVTMLGPSGCGKTTTLRMIAGFEFANAGNIYIGDKEVSDLPPNKRNTAMVFQSYALFPHLNVFDNIAYGLKIYKLPKEEIKKRVNNILKLVDLEKLGKRTTGQISGGQQQRVALARALVMEPDLLLFDEPLSNLDAKLRVYMRNEIKKIQQTMGITAVYVTHDQSEAMSLSDKIIIMNKGKIEQMGTPREIYYHPVNRFVAEFIGNANFLERKIISLSPGKAKFILEDSEIEVDYVGDKKPGETCSLVIRPEAIEVGSKGNMTGKITRSTFMGHIQEYDIEGSLNDEKFFVEDSNPQGKTVYTVGENVKLNILAQNVHIVD